MIDVYKTAAALFLHADKHHQRRRSFMQKAFCADVFLLVTAGTGACRSLYSLLFCEVFSAAIANQMKITSFNYCLAQLCLQQVSL